MSNLDKQRLWDERIQAFLASGQSQRAWCDEQGLSQHQLSYWLRKHRAKELRSAGTRWVNLNSSASSGVSLRIGEIVVEVQPGFSQQILVDVMRSLMALC